MGTTRRERAAGVGKSSWIQSFISHTFPPDGTVPRVLDPQQLRSPMRAVHARHPIARTLATYNLTLTDTDASAVAPHTRRGEAGDAADARDGEERVDASALQAYLRETSPDVVILCYGCDEPESLARLIERWLPALEATTSVKPHWPYLPVLLCGLKRDIEDNDNPNLWADILRRTVTATNGRGVTAELNGEDDADIRDALESNDCEKIRLAITERCFLAFRCLQEALQVSAFRPDEDAGIAGELGELINKAAHTIMYPMWPLYDPYTDRLTAHFEAACIRIFRICDMDHDTRLSHAEFAAFQLRAYGLRLLQQELQHSFNLMRRDAPAAFTDDGLYMLESGLVALFRSLILKTDRKSVWQALYAFGYRLGVRPYVDADAGTILHDAAAVAAAAAETQAAAKSQASPEPGVFGLYLDVPETYLHLRSAHADSIFMLAGTSTWNPSTNAVLDEAVRHSGAGISFVASLFRQYSTAPHTVLTFEDLTEMFVATPSQMHPFGTLYPFNTEHNIRGEIGLVSWINLWQMLLATAPRRAALALYELGFCMRDVRNMDVDMDPRAAVEETAPRKQTPGAPIPVRRAFVLGSAGAGKTSVILHFLLGGGAQLSRYVAQVAAETGGPAPAPTTAVTHYVAAVPHSTPAGSGTSDAAAGTSAMMEAAIPSTLVLTEYPEAQTDAALGIAEDAADAVLFVVDPSNVHSIEFFLAAVDAVPDNVPVVVCCTLHADRREAAPAGKTLIDALCSSGDTVMLPQDLVESLSAAGLKAARELVAPDQAGLHLEVFGFSPTTTALRTQDLFKYVAAVSAFPLRDNPRTRTRRDRERWGIMRRRIIVGVVVTALAGFGIAYAVHEPTRTAVHDAAQRARRSLNDLVEAISGKVPSAEGALDADTRK